MRIPALALASLCAACIQNPETTAETGNVKPSTVSAYGRELGTLTAIYPIPRADGGYDLELRMSRDTVWVDFEAARAYAADSLGHALFRSAQEPFFTRDENCLHSPKKEACLEFRPSL